MKRVILLILFICLFSVSVNAAGLSLTTKVLDNLIMIGEEAVFDITMKNDQITNDKVTFIISDLDWEWEKQTFDINSGGSETFRLRVKAPEGVIKAGLYSLNLKVYSTVNTNVYVYEPLLITVLDESSLLKLEKIDYSINGLDPFKDTNVLRLIIKNQYDKPVNNVEISLESEIFNYYSRKVNFDEAELKIEEFSVKLNNKAVEGMHDVRVILKKDSEVLLNQVRKVKVQEHPDIKEDKEVNNGFLIKRVSVIRKNEGNTISEQVYRLRLGSFERLFSDVNPRPSSIDKSGSDYYYIWEFIIRPGEQYEINIETNYRDPMFLLIALIIIIYLILYLAQRGISINKKALTIKSKEGISHMKVLLLIKNKGKTEIRNLRVVDQLYNVKNVPSDYGTLRPSKVNRNGDDVTLVWDGISLIGKEERILSYKVNVEVRNKIMLPRAMVRYNIGKKSYLARSNRSLIVG